MSNPQLAAQLIAEQYGARPIALYELQNYSFSWRGIYRADHADGSAWVVRMINRSEAAGGFAGTAALLDWLEAQGYSAPRTVPTSAGTRVGRADPWHVLATTFVPGTLAEQTPIHLRAIGAALGGLHKLAVPLDHRPVGLPDSIWPPGIFGYLRQQLTTSAEKWPAKLSAIYRRFLTILDEIEAAGPLPFNLIHGDCWPLNAIRTPGGEMVLIDWDNAGYGPALLDLAKLLLTAHYDLSRPLMIEPNEAWIAAILRGYTDVRPLRDQERRLLPAALPFWLVYSAADYTVQADRAAPEDLFFQKLRARLAGAEIIAEIVRRYV